MKTNKVISQILQRNPSLSFEDIYNSLLREFYFASGSHNSFLKKHPELTEDSLYFADFKVTSWTQDSGNLNTNVEIRVPDVFVLKPRTEETKSYILSNNLALYNFRTDGAHYNDDVIDYIFESDGLFTRKVFYYYGTEVKKIPTKDYLLTEKVSIFNPELEAYLYSRLIRSEHFCKKLLSQVDSLTERLNSTVKLLEEHLNKPTEVRPAFSSHLDQDKIIDGEQYEEKKPLTVADILNTKEGQTLSIQIDSDGQMQSVDNVRVQQPLVPTVQDKSAVQNFGKEDTETKSESEDKGSSEVPEDKESAEVEETKESVDSESKIVDDRNSKPTRNKKRGIFFRDRNKS